jgi:antitoxin HigA-1
MHAGERHHARRVRAGHAGGDAPRGVSQGVRLSQSRLALAIGISPNRIADIVRNRRRITADTALRLSVYFGNSPEFWLNMQTHYDLKIARRQLSPEAAERIRAHRAA